MHWPNPWEKYPLKWFKQLWFLKNFITSENISVWDYTYYDDLNWPENFEKNNVLYHFPFIWDPLIIWKFCAIATGVRFIMNGANHKISGVSTFPFYIFSHWWEKSAPKEWELPYKWDTVIWNDVWIWYDATIMPGVKIWNGSIIGAKSVVTKDVEPYTVVWWNPAKVIKQRFDGKTIQELETLQWWNWPVEKITKNLDKITWDNVEDMLS